MFATRVKFLSHFFLLILYECFVTITCTCKKWNKDSYKKVHFAWKQREPVVRFELVNVDQLPVRHAKHCATTPFINKDKQHNGFARYNMMSAKTTWRLTFLSKGIRPATKWPGIVHSQIVLSFWVSTVTHLSVLQWPLYIFLWKETLEQHLKKNKKRKRDLR